MTEFPEPLTSADCDLRGLPFMPLDVVRLGDSDLAALSTGDEFKAAVLLWCKAWLQVPAASLPDDDRVLAHLTGLGPKWKKVRAMALKGWVMCSDGRLYHPVIAEKAREAWKHRQSQRERANKRWGNTGTPSPGNATEGAVAHATASKKDATALPQDMQGRGRGTGTVEGKHQAQPSRKITNLEPSREKPPLGITDPGSAFEYVCRESDWRPANDSQRQSALDVIRGWLAFAPLELILAGIASARSRKPSEPTKSLKRFDSTIRGMAHDRGIEPTRPPAELIEQTAASLRAH